MKISALSDRNLALIKSKTIEASHAAGAVLLQYFGRSFDVREKAQAGLVTNADLEAEQAALRVLRKARPDFGFLAEESGVSDPSKDGRWILDPLDGTTNFVHGFPMFCVSIAAEWQNQVVVGVIYHPVLKETYWSIRGKGAYLEKKRLKVSKTTQLKDSLLTTGFTYRKDELPLEMRPFEKLSATVRAIRRPGSAALDLAYTARGVFDGFWERNLSPWDVAAGSLLVEEAGGKVTDFQGKSFSIEGSEILATNKILHAQIQNELRITL
ncbi:MAG: inositol monophosphatase [Bdellovibrionales bacterium]|nr:inositol monophosphatase [Bdellovibrionales bacterium]